MKCFVLEKRTDLKLFTVAAMGTRRLESLMPLKRLNVDMKNSNCSSESDS